MGTDDEVLDWVRRDAETALHPSCTCRMGVEDDSVLDPRTIRVHGIDGLRVVDRGIDRYITNGNTERQLRQLGRRRAGGLFRQLLDADLALKGSSSSTDRSRLVLEQLIVGLSSQAAEVQ